MSEKIKCGRNKRIGRMLLLNYEIIKAMRSIPFTSSKSIIKDVKDTT